MIIKVPNLSVGDTPQIIYFNYPITIPLHHILDIRKLRLIEIFLQECNIIEDLIELAHVVLPYKYFVTG